MHSYGSSPYSSALLASHLSIKGVFENPSQNIHIEETRFPVYIPDRTSILMVNLIIYSHYVSVVKVFLLWFLYGLHPFFEKEGISPDVR